MWAIFAHGFVEDRVTNQGVVKVRRVVFRVGHRDNFDLGFHLALEDLAEFLKIEFLREPVSAAHVEVHVIDLSHKTRSERQSADCLNVEGRNGSDFARFVQEQP